MRVSQHCMNSLHFVGIALREEKGVLYKERTMMKLIIQTGGSMNVRVQTAVVVLIGVCMTGVLPVQAWLGIFGGGEQDAYRAVEQTSETLPDPGKAGSVEEELQQLREAFRFFKADRERIRDMLTQSQGEKEALRQQIEDLEQTLDKSRANVAKLTLVLRKQLAAAVRDGQDVKDLRRELKAWENEADDYLATDMNKELGRLKEANERQQSQISLLKDQLQDAQEELRSVRRTKAENQMNTTSTPHDQKVDRDVLELAQQAMDAQRPEEALALFREALASGGDETTARMGMAASLYAMDNLEDALEQIDRLLEMDAGNPGALGLKGIISWRTGDAEIAVALLDEAIATEDKSAQLYNYRGIIAHAQGDYNLAEQSFRQAIELEPDHSEAMFNLSVVLATSAEPDIEEARNVYEAALRQGSDPHSGLEELLYPAE